MSIATGSNTATPAQATAQQPPSAAAPSQRAASETATRELSTREPAANEPAANESEVALALSATIQNASRIGELLDVLRTARLWLPLPGDGSHSVSGADVTLPLVSYLGSDFVPAYTSAELLRQADSRGADSRSGPLRPQPHAIVRAADLARLLPPVVGIALNPGDSQSIPLYPQAVAYLTADYGADRERIRVGPLPVRPDGLLADIAAGLLHITAVQAASAAWVSVRFGGEGLLICVTLDDPADSAARDAVVGAVERAAWQASAQDAGFAIDVTFPGEYEPDHIDESIAAFATPFYRR